MDDHPVRLALADDLERTRLTVFFRLLLTLPHVVWFLLWTVLVALLWLPAWAIALLRGRLPGGLHRLFAAYVRYGIHIGGYVGLVANPFPGFSGGDGYPVDAVLPAEPGPQRRSRIAFRLPLALPALLLAGVLGAGISDPSAEPGGASFTGTIGVAAACAVLGWFASLALGRMPVGLRDLGAYALGYSAQTYAYALLLTDRYPSADPARIGPEWSAPPHPVRLRLEDDGRRSRLTVLFRILLALPHAIWLLLWTVPALLAALANAVVAVVRGRSAEPLHRFLAAYVRYSAHVTAYAALLANPFPGFTGEPGYPVDVELGPLAPQRRLVTVFRFPLGIPAAIVATALTGALVAVGVLGWFAALATGRMPEGLRNLGAVAVRYLAQANAYWLIVLDDYPHASPVLPSAPAEQPL